MPPGDAGVVAARLREPLSLVHVENVDSGDAEAVVGALAQDLAGCALIASARVTTLGTDGWWRTVPLQSFDDDTALDQLAQELEETPSRDGLGAAAPSPRPSPARGEGEQGRTQDSLSLDGRGWRATARRVRVGNDALDLEAASPRRRGDARSTLARLRERVASFSEPGEGSGRGHQCAKTRRSSSGAPAAPRRCTGAASAIGRCSVGSSAASTPSVRTSSISSASKRGW